MALLLGFLGNLWDNIMNSCLAGLTQEARNNIGLGTMVAAILLFVWSMQGSKKTQVINSWFLFWLSVIVLIVSITYLAY
ncbi:MAG: hypothetical protein E7354_00075 [Clostridiales bacterium]|nr:hypothetical protein [Clostridiales bacterium]